MTAQSPTQVGDLSQAQFDARLRDRGLGLRIGPFDVNVRTDVHGLREPLYRLYRDHPLIEPGRVFTAHVALREIWRFERRPRRYVRFTVDGRTPHEDLPSGQVLAVFEWGLNLVIALRMHCFLMLHSAVLERHGRALALPAAPGSGKTTLCAALAARGWRLLSDEFGLLRPGTTDFLPVPRPMPLKNESIAIMQSFAPGIELGPVIPETRKGTVAHVRPSTDSVRRQHETAAARWLVFPEWRPACRTNLQQISAMHGFMRLATNAFNYEMLGASAFETARDLVDRSRRFHLTYSNLNEAVDAITTMADGDAD